MWQVKCLFALCACALLATSVHARGRGSGLDWDWKQQCNPFGEPSSDQVEPLDVEPISQVRTLVGTYTVDVGTCPVGSCRYDSRRHKRCDDDGYICAETQPQEVDMGEYGSTTVEVVVACKCCKNTGITINGRVLDAETDDPIPDVNLRISLASSDVSGSDGAFTFVISSSSERVVINANIAGYVSAMKVVDIPENFRGPVDVVVAMVRLADPVEIDASVDNDLEVSGDPEDPRATVTIPARSFRTRRGVYTGTVLVSINFLNTSDPNVEDEIVGQFITDNGEALISGGIFALTYQAKNGEPLYMGQVTVTLSGGMKLWELTQDGEWSQIGSTVRRGKRQADLNSEIVQARLNNGQWVNIDKIPGAPRCYYKARIFDEISGIEITFSATTSFKPYAVSYTTLNQRLRFYASATNQPADTCFEVRCPNIATDQANLLIGVISMDSYEVVSIGGISLPVVTTLKPRLLPAYDPVIQPNLNAVQYAVLSNNEELFINFISDVNGPFYTSKPACESSTISQPSFHFLKPNLPSYVPYPGNVKLCTARIGFFDGYNFYDVLGLLDALPTVTAVSTWSDGGQVYYYTDVAVMEISTVGDFVFVCIKYRCSTDDANTTVYLDFDIPTFTIETLRGDYNLSAFSCYGNCSTLNCWHGDEIAQVRGQETVDGSFIAPVNVSRNGPDFFKRKGNNCAWRFQGEAFAARYMCYSYYYYYLNRRRTTPATITPTTSESTTPTMPGPTTPNGRPTTPRSTTPAPTTPTPITSGSTTPTMPGPTTPNGRPTTPRSTTPAPTTPTPITSGATTPTMTGPTTPNGRPTTPRSTSPVGRIKL